MRPTLEYVSSVWDPATNKNIAKLEGGGMVTPEQPYQDDTTSVAVLRTAQVHGEAHYDVQDTEWPSRHGEAHYDVQDTERPSRHYDVQDTGYRTA